MNRLWVRLSVAFALVTLVGVGVAALLAPYGEVYCTDGRTLQPRELAAADVLLVRSRGAAGTRAWASNTWSGMEKRWGHGGLRTSSGRGPPWPRTKR